MSVSPCLPDSVMSMDPEVSPTSSMSCLTVKLYLNSRSASPAVKLKVLDDHRATTPFAYQPFEGKDLLGQGETLVLASSQPLLSRAIPLLLDLPGPLAGDALLLELRQLGGEQVAFPLEGLQGLPRLH